MMSEHRIKTFVYNFSHKIGLTTLAKRITHRKIKILMYHGICDNDEPVSCWWQLKKDIFENQIQYLHKKFTILSLDEAISILANQKPVPPNCILITFDDGYKNFLTNALPILKSRNIPSTLYITTDPVSRNELIWSDGLYFDLFQLENDIFDFTSLGLGLWGVKTETLKINAIQSTIDTLKEMPDNDLQKKIADIYIKMNLKKKSNNSDNLFSILKPDEVKMLSKEKLVTIGSHAITHKPLTSLSMNQVADELMGSKKYLKELTGRDINHFCYPAGYYNEKIVKTVKDAGYRSAVLAGGAHQPVDDMFKIPRIGLGGSDSDAFFKCQVNGLVGLKDNIKQKFL